MAQAPQDRIEQLEKLVATLRHDLRGAITPAALIADRLRNSSDPTIQRSAARITDVIERTMDKVTFIDHPTLDEYFESDGEARNYAADIMHL